MVLAPDARKRALDAATELHGQLSLQIAQSAASEEERLIMLQNLQALWSCVQFAFADDGAAVFPSLFSQVRR